MPGVAQALEQTGGIGRAPEPFLQQSDCLDGVSPHLEDLGQARQSLDLRGLGLEDAPVARGRQFQLAVLMMLSRLINPRRQVSFQLRPPIGLDFPGS